jgi:hypothetical protein
MKGLIKKILREQVLADSTLDERFTTIKGEEFTGVGKADIDVPDRMRVQSALEAAEDDVRNNIFSKIGGTVVSQPTFLGDMTVKWEDGTEDTFFGRRYWEDISEHEDGSAMTGKIGEIWVDRKTGAEVTPPKWLDKERIRNPLRLMKRERFFKKHAPIATSTVTYKIR